MKVEREYKDLRGLEGLTPLGMSEEFVIPTVAAIALAGSCPFRGTLWAAPLALVTAVAERVRLFFT